MGLKFMFSSIEKTGNISVVKADLTWGRDLDTIYEIVSGYFSDFNDNGFYPHPEEEVLQKTLLTVPTLQRFAAAMQKLQARGATISNLGLQGLPEERRNAALYAIALTLGFPTSTDQRTKRVAWDVKARPETDNDARFVTFSERIGSADMHTDSSFYPMPEEQFFLYVVKAARCNGGHSILIDNEDLYRHLHETAEGRAAYELLRSTEIPFRVPAVYATNDDNVEYFMAPVITEGDEGKGGFKIRWRYDAITKGLAARPDLRTPELVAALELMHHVAEVSAPRLKEQLPDDTLLWANNHRALHGRTYYEDPARHLVRIRISDVPNAQRIGPSGIVRD
jgi:alpha-ketoglutarate-dependent taurine dioxygenase